MEDYDVIREKKKGSSNAGVVIVLNFGLDMESSRQRRRQLAPGLSRFVLVVLATAIYRSKSKARLFWIGVLLRFGPIATFKLTELVYAVTQRLRGPHSLLAGDGTSVLRFGDDNSCAICLDDSPPDWSARCGHVFHAQCLETWARASREATCPVCKAAVEVRPDILADLFSFTEVKWLRHHAVLGALYWSR